MAANMEELQNQRNQLKTSQMAFHEELKLWTQVKILNLDMSDFESMCRNPDTDLETQARKRRELQEKEKIIEQLLNKVTNLQVAMGTRQEPEPNSGPRDAQTCPTIAEFVQFQIDDLLEAIVKLGQSIMQLGAQIYALNNENIDDERREYQK